MPHPRRTLDTPGGQVHVFANAGDACALAAERLASTIREAAAARGQAVLGLATGGTPIPVYARLVAMHRAGNLSFRDVSTYNLDEYYPIGPLDPNSYRAYMHTHLFEHVDIAPNRAHVLDGTVPEAFVDEHCAAFERWIADDGGLDLQLLGIGRNGHIGFNEPCDLPVDEALTQPTRRVALHPMTVADAARDFGGDPARVPAAALTLGVAPIVAARAILVLAFGPRKAEPLAAALNGPPTAQVPASLLQAVRGRVTWLVDEAAAAGIAD
jgi:glucosamine-6-phosphate deaminase